ncbi:MAG: GAF domain-containing protein [Anaerolineae bacterium]|nr:GAF domain-containing protein [Anaerolineae bacterium]
MHSLLKQQLAQLQLDLTTLPSAWQPFITQVNQTYTRLNLNGSAEQNYPQTLPLQVMLNALPDLFFRLDEQGTVLDYKDGSNTSLGIPPEQFLGQRLNQFFPADLANQCQKILERAARQQEITTWEYSWPGDKERFYEMRAIPLKPKEIIVIVRDITRRIQAEQALQKQKSLLENLVRIARITTSQPDLEATLQNVLEVAASLTQAAQGNLILLNSTGQPTHAIRTGRNPPTRDPLYNTSQVLQSGVAGWVKQQQKSVLIGDAQQDERWINVTEAGTSIRSVLCLPILHANQLLGILTLLHQEPDFFTQEHLQMLEAAADQISLALRNAQIYDAQRQMTTRQFTLYELLRIAGEQLDPDPVMTLAVKAIARLTPWFNISLSTPIPNQEQWVIRAATGNLVNRIGVTYQFRQGIIGRAMHTRQIQLVSDVTTDADFVRGPADTRSELAVPLLRGDRLLGVLDIQSNQLDGFAHDDLLLAESLAGAVALALDNARLYSDVEAHLNEISVLYTVAQMSTRSLIMEDVLQEALFSSVTSLGFSGGMILLLEPESGQLALAAAHNLPDAVTTYLQSCLPEQNWLAYAHYQQRVVMLLDWAADVPQVPSSLMQTLAELGWQSYAAAPLLHHAESLGVLCLWDKLPQTKGQLTSAFMAAMGHQIAIAIANARLHQTVAHKQSQLQTVLDASRDGIILLTEAGQIPVLNAAAQELFNLAGPLASWSNQSLSSRLMRLRHTLPAVVKIIIAELRRARQGEAAANEGEWELANRVIHWLNLPVANRAGSLERLFVLRDITQERQLERLREDLIQTMVHDLRNPLNAISGAVELIRYDEEANFSSDSRQMVDLIEQSAHKILDLVNTIMDISRLESQQMPLQWAAFRVKDLFVESEYMQRSLAERKRVTVHYQAANDLPLAWADSGLIARVLQNLLDNALKFTPSGGTVRLEAHLHQPESESPAIIISVQDSGPGISPEIQDRLFEKFVTGRQRGSGSGIGLAFCQLAVEAHSGRIWVDSVPGQGAVFYFTIPIYQP